MIQTHFFQPRAACGTTLTRFSDYMLAYIITTVIIVVGMLDKSIIFGIQQQLVHIFFCVNFTRTLFLSSLFITFNIKTVFPVFVFSVLQL
jgi:hypothetical protein